MSEAIKVQNMNSVRFTIKIKKDSWIFWVIILAYISIFPMPYLTQSSSISKLYNLLLIGMVFILLALYLMKIYRLTIDTFIACSIAYCLILFLSTFINTGNMTGCMLQIFRIMAAVLFTQWGIRYELHRFVRSLRLLMLIYTVSNTISVVLFPRALYLTAEGYATCWLLGPDNSSVRYYILTLFLSWFIRYIEAKKSLSEMAAFLNFGVFVFRRSIGSGMVAFACMAVFIIMSRIKLVYDRVKLYHIFAGGGILFLLLMTINNFAVFQPLFTLIGKEMYGEALSGRTNIWEITVSQLLQSPLIGFGYLTGEQFYNKIGHLCGLVIHTAHNTFLMLFVNGGIIMAIVFLIGMLGAARNFDRIYKTIGQKKCSCLLYASVIAFILHANVEGNNILCLWIIAGCFDSIKNLEQEERTS